MTVEKKNGCTIVTAPDVNSNSCEGGSSIDSVIGDLGIADSGELKAFITTVTEAFADMKPVGITVQQVGGQWYVSPVGTIADAILAALAALDNQELTAIIDAGRSKLSAARS